MKLVIKSKIVITEAIRNHLDRRIQFALGRFSNLIESVTIRLVDINGPKGGADKQCRALVNISGIPAIAVEEKHNDIYMAIDRICDRLGRTVTRRRDRMKELAV